MRVGINGFGRIGRNTLKALLKSYPQIEVVAINDLSGAKDCAHLFKYDSNYGVFPGEVSADAETLKVAGQNIKVLGERDPSQIGWNKCGVDLVIESTGFFTDALLAKKHIEAGGAKKVIISAPARNEDLTVVLGVNDHLYDADRHNIISNASCTTNCLAAALKPIVDTLGWRRGFMSTIHAYTNDQNILDAPHKDLRRARNAATNIIPTTSGAAKALYLAIPEMKGTFDGFALRVPTATVSMCYVVFVTQEIASRGRLNEVLKAAATKGPLHNILGYTEEELVSSDFRGSALSATVDANLTQAQEDLAQICVWYDNEWGYASRLADLTHKLATT